MALNRLLLLIVLGFGSVFSSWGHASEAAPLFELEVLSIFTNKCGKCHSETVRKGELDLSSMTGIVRGGESGEELIAESVEDSILWMMIADGEMPPSGHEPLLDDEISLIRRWIAGGGQSEHPVVTQTEAQLTQHDVLPILLLRCTACHGARIRQGGLDLRTPLAMRRGGDHGPAFVPGDPDHSLMIQRIESEACPPSESLLKFFVRRPGSSEVAVIRDWIAT